MKLERALEIQAKLDGQLEPDRDWEVDRILREDPDAAALRDELSSVRAAIRAHEPAVSVPEPREFYWAQIQRRMVAEQKSSGRAARNSHFPDWLRWLTPALGLAAVALVVSRSLIGGSAGQVASADVLTFRSDSDRVTIHWIN